MIHACVWQLYSVSYHLYWIDSTEAIHSLVGCTIYIFDMMEYFIIFTIGLWNLVVDLTKLCCKMVSSGLRSLPKVTCLPHQKCCILFITQVRARASSSSAMYNICWACRTLLACFTGYLPVKRQDQVLMYQCTKSLAWYIHNSIF